MSTKGTKAMHETRHFQVSMPKPVYDRMMLLCEAKGYTKSEAIRAALREWMERQV